MIELLEEVYDDNRLFFILPTLNVRRAIYVFVHYRDFYMPFSEIMAKSVVELADPATLKTFCFNRRIHPLIRRDLIRQIVQAGKQADMYVPLFLTELIDLTTVEEVRIALAEALGILTIDEQIIATLVKLYQEEALLDVKDALYTALYKIARRTNITIVPGASEGHPLRIMRRE